MAQANLEIKGIQETLALLHKIDPTYRRQVTKRITRAGDVMVTEARSMITTITGVKGAPLSGMPGAIRKVYLWQTLTFQAVAVNLE